MDIDWIQSYKKEVEPDPLLVSRAKSWYETFTGRSYSAHDYKELVDMYKIVKELA